MNRIAPKIPVYQWLTCFPQMLSYAMATKSEKLVQCYRGKTSFLTIPIKKEFLAS